MDDTGSPFQEQIIGEDEESELPNVGACGRWSKTEAAYRKGKRVHRTYQMDGLPLASEESFATNSAN